MEEVRIWNTVRSAAEIQANMNKELDPASHNNLIAYYTFNEGITSGTNTGMTTVMDLKNNHNARLVNFTMAGNGFHFLPQRIGPTTLPLVWNSFTAQAQKDNIFSQWSTLHEQNTAHFIIQHSADKQKWNG